ncbi:hypothetical protein Mal4_12790 [Maioricimonas rarisocia]|uniref:Uncharacterized protein n=1 Tax=Maioricimonas rarisocia TaxID=2528026 RepID=A0A517Z3F6_9PLAN|nr:hypothetical protein [Maioricimonas rarisocia]QDU36976.1 hypothetical protein Mal4_12790 [Maioricimonas rarisocia]
MLKNNDGTAGLRALATTILAGGLLLSLTAGLQASDQIVVPNALETVEGNGNNGFPFNIANFGRNSQRYQQIYDAGDFAALSGPVLITELIFRPDIGTGRRFSSTLPDIQINLSTTTFAVDQLSTTFADNVGTDDTIVFDGALSLSSADTGAGPRDFDIVIVLDTPFLYNPAAGNLLLDVRNYGGGFTTQFDAHFASSDPTSRTSTNVTGGVNSTTADFADSGGLVTKFTYVPAAIEVLVDIKPGSDKNPVNLKSNSKSKGKSAAAGGVLPVAILTTDDYDALLTDETTVLFGDPELGGAAAPIRSTVEDVDDDGDDDLLLHFSIRELVDSGAIDGDSLILALTGLTLDGLLIEGFDLVTVKP